MQEPLERPIEKLLKAAAARRCAQAGSPVMHAATREILRTEVRRNYGVSGRSSAMTVRWIFRLLPRLAMVLVLAGCAWLLWLQRSDQAPVQLALQQPDTLREAVPEELEHNESPAPLAVRSTVGDLERGAAPDTIESKQPEFAPAPSESPVVSSGTATLSVRNRLLEETSASVAGPDYFKSDRQGMYMGTSSGQAKDLERAGRKQEVDLGQLVASAPGAPMAGKVERDKPADRSQPGGVLQNFTVLNEGEALRLVDSDGSTYQGRIQQVQAEVPPPAATLPAERDAAGLVRTPFNPPPVVGTDGNAMLSLYSLSASGTNRTLGQSLQFTGNVALTERQVQSGRTLFSNTVLPMVGQPAPSASQALSSRGRLQGAAVLQDGRDVAVDAVPAGP
jgi:hypothetical protein